MVIQHRRHTLPRRVLRPLHRWCGKVLAQRRLTPPVEPLCAAFKGSLNMLDILVLAANCACPVTTSRAAER